MSLLPLTRRDAAEMVAELKTAKLLDGYRGAPRRDVPAHMAALAEHGIGTHKREYLPYCRTPEEIALMRTIKSALDPKGIMNPGKALGDFA